MEANQPMESEISFLWAQQTTSPGAWEQIEAPVARFTSDLYPVPWEMRYFGGDCAVDPTFPSNTCLSPDLSADTSQLHRCFPHSGQNTKASLEMTTQLLNTDAVCGCTGEVNNTSE